MAEPRLTIRMKASHRDALKIAAQVEGRSMESIIGEAFERWLKSHPRARGAVDAIRNIVPHRSGV